MPLKRAFVALQDRFVSSLAVACCPTMDLIAVLTLDHHLLVYRTTSWQKLLQIKSSDVGFEIVAIAWKPNGHQLALGCDKGNVAIVEIESGDILPERRSTLCHQSCITAMQWVQIYQPKSSSIRSRSKLHFRNRSSRFFNHSQAEDDIDDTVLVTADEQGFLTLWWMGRVLLTRIDTQKLVEKIENQQDDTIGFRIEQVHLAPDMSALLVLLTFPSKSCQHVDLTKPDPLDTKLQRLLTLDLTAIQYMHEDVALVVTIFDRTHIIVNQITSFGRQMATEWKNAMHPFELKMGLIGSLYEKYACEDLPQVDMLSVAVTGITAPALAQYFAQDIQATSVYRMQKALFSGCEVLEGLVGEKLKRELVNFLFLVSELRGHIKWKPKTYSTRMGISADALDDLVAITQDALVATEKLTLAIYETRQDFALFFQWLLERIRVQTNSPASGKVAGASSRDTGHAANSSQSLLNLRRLCEFLTCAAKCATNVRHEQSKTSVYTVETTFGNKVSQQLSTSLNYLTNTTTSPSVGCLSLLKRLHEKWSMTFDAIGVTLPQSVIRKESGSFSIGSNVVECRVRFRQPFSVKRVDDIYDRTEDDGIDDGPIDWSAMKHIKPTPNGSNKKYIILIGLRLQSGVLLLLRATQDPLARLQWESAIVGFSQGLISSPRICRGFDFYGDTSTKRSERLALVVDRISEEDHAHEEWLYLQQYDNIPFCALSFDTSIEYAFQAAKAHDLGYTFDIDELPGRIVALMPSAGQRLPVVLATASRGIMCVILPPNRLTVYDAEDIENDDDSEVCGETDEN
ncbi:hypothetical protein CCR75_006218 [Bremia lactucae]|uniref:Anaphase-promoting complex subunit 4 n=1 Tax=Bremia lactucae TaxID=4779 RepID=A0A976ICS8_BRELC|nr:hypothetical protein CCR75_006218 [Bremia lactucae]